MRFGKYVALAALVALTSTPAKASDVFTWPQFKNGGSLFKLKAATSGHLATLKAPDSLAQDTVFTLPDAGSATDTWVSASANNTFTGVNTFPTGGIVLKGTSFNATLKALAALGQTSTITIPDPGAATAKVVLDTGTQTLGGTYTFSNPPTITGGLTAANIQSGSAKRELMTAQLSPNTGAAADSTVYRATLCPGRAGVVKRINFFCQTAPTVGTDTLKVLKNGSSGNTMLNAATFDANSLTANTASNATLTATSGDLTLAATDTIYCEYSAGSQTVDAIGVGAVIEFEPTDF